MIEQPTNEQYTQSQQSRNIDLLGRKERGALSAEINEQNKLDKNCRENQLSSILAVEDVEEIMKNARSKMDQLVDKTLNEKTDPNEQKFEISQLVQLMNNLINGSFSANSVFSTVSFPKYNKITEVISKLSEMKDPSSSVEHDTFDKNISIKPDVPPALQSEIDMITQDAQQIGIHILSTYIILIFQMLSQIYKHIMACSCSYCTYKNVFPLNLAEQAVTASTFTRLLVTKLPTTLRQFADGLTKDKMIEMQYLGISDPPSIKLQKEQQTEAELKERQGQNEDSSSNETNSTSGAEVNDGGIAKRKQFRKEYLEKKKKQEEQTTDESTEELSEEQIYENNKNNSNEFFRWSDGKKIHSSDVENKIKQDLPTETSIPTLRQLPSIRDKIKSLNEMRKEWKPLFDDLKLKIFEPCPTFRQELAIKDDHVAIRYPVKIEDDNIFEDIIASYVELEGNLQKEKVRIEYSKLYKSLKGDGFLHPPVLVLIKNPLKYQIQDDNISIIDGQQYEPDYLQVCSETYISMSRLTISDEYGISINKELDEDSVSINMDSSIPDPYKYDILDSIDKFKKLLDDFYYFDIDIDILSYTDPYVLHKWLKMYKK